MVNLVSVLVSSEFWTNHMYYCLVLVLKVLSLYYSLLWLINRRLFQY